MALGTDQTQDSSKIFKGLELRISYGPPSPQLFAPTPYLIFKEITLENNSKEIQGFDSSCHDDYLDFLCPSW